MNRRPGNIGLKAERMLKKFLIIECARQVVRIPFQNEVDIFRSRKERGGEKMRDLKEAVTNEFISNVSVK